MYDIPRNERLTFNLRYSANIKGSDRLPKCNRHRVRSKYNLRFSKEPLLSYFKRVPLKKGKLSYNIQWTSFGYLTHESFSMGTEPMTFKLKTLDDCAISYQ